MSENNKCKNKNQWTELSEEKCRKAGCHKSHKTATDNQWISTMKNGVDNDK
ncbi:conserved hypothetical protein [Clostridium botulinum C str. Eklund]|nr:conserved hypothetical protein [Clostridium botulinum C str. Eklund]